MPYTWTDHLRYLRGKEAEQTIQQILQESLVNLTKKKKKIRPFIKQ